MLGSRPAVSVAMEGESETGIDKGVSVLAPDNVAFAALLEELDALAMELDSTTSCEGAASCKVPTSCKGAASWEGATERAMVLLSSANTSKDGVAMFESLAIRIDVSVGVARTAKIGDSAVGGLGGPTS